MLRELRPVQGGATEGFEFKWTENGQTYRIRVHNSDPSAPVGTNANNGWVVRVQRGKWYYDPTINDFREAKYFDPNGPFFDELPPHTRDFSRELGGIFLNFTFTYGIMSIWIKVFI